MADEEEVGGEEQDTDSQAIRGEANSHIDHIAILGMDHGRHAQLPRAHEDVEHLAVPQLHRRIRHVQLDARDPLVVDHPRQLVLQNRRARPRQDQVEPVVDVALPRRPSVVLRHHGRQRRVVALLRRERQDRRVAARQRRP